MSETGYADYELDSGMVLVTSDSHGRYDNLIEVIDKVSPDLILHLGDSEDYEGRIFEIAKCPVVIVRGNCDYSGSFLQEAIVRLGRHYAFLAHGHRHGVRFGLTELADAAIENGCDAAMFGHTHEPELTEEQGITIYNPGSISLPRQDGHEPSFLTIHVDNEGEWHTALKYLTNQSHMKKPAKKARWFW